MQKTKTNRMKVVALVALSTVLPTIMAQSTLSETCIPLATSQLCPAFSNSYISTTSQSTYPFLAFVSNTSQFDTRFSTYIQAEYVQSKYMNVLGCTGLDLTNTTNLYARYTTSVLCNAMVQDGLRTCGNLTTGNTSPLCASSCALFAESEQVISFDSQTCNSTRSDRTDQIRSDFTICALPAYSLSGTCILASQNENANCGYGNNLPGLCSYCGSSSPNNTDSCCYTTNTTACAGVRLPPTSSLPPLFTQTVTATPSATSTNAVAGGKHAGLSGGAIAGITIGVIAALILLALLALFLVRRRRTTQSTTTVFNQPSPRRQGADSSSRTPMAFAPGGAAAVGARGGDGYEVLPSGRIARMSALETPGSVNGASASEGTPNSRVDQYSVGPAAYGSSSSSNPNTPRAIGGSIVRSSPSTDPRSLQPPPRGLHNTRMSNGSNTDPMASPGTDVDGGLSSPLYNSSQQSEQLAFFKDYYSPDEIRPNDKVTTLWAYAPRAADEFELERGDMLRVVGIWDDGWATGVRINEKADDKTTTGRISESSSSRRQSDATAYGEIKAFPLVCVCLPEHWQQTIDQENEAAQANEGTTFFNPPPGGSDPEGYPAGSDPMSSATKKPNPKSSSRFQDDLHVAKS